MARDEKRTIGDALYELLHPFEARDRRLAEEERARRSREEYGERKERQTAAELAKLSNRGCYYVFNDLPTLHAGNIDHLVVGPEGVTLVETKGNSGIVEAHPAGDGKLSLTVDGKPLHRNISAPR